MIKYTYTFAEAVGEVLRELRDAKGMTQEELAEKLTTVKVPTYPKIEQAKTKATTKHMEDIARALDTKPSEIFRLAEEKMGW